LNNENFATTDISHSRVIIQIKGLQTKEVLKKGCPINFNEFEKNKCVGSVFHGINIVVDCVDDYSQTFNLLTLRSFGESLYHHITDASLEFGYVGV
jgi:sarcosine oxidase subunit gamma